MFVVGYLWDRAGDAWLLLWYGHRKQTEVTVGGTRVRFWTADAYSRRWFYPRYAGGRIHEEKVTRLITEYMHGSRCFVDAGANLGFFTCLGAALLPDGRVYAFEMNELFHGLLRKNVELNAAGNVEAVHAAVTDRAGEVSYTKRPRSRYRPTLRLTTDPRQRWKGREVIVSAVSLDEFFADNDAVPDLVKIDVEGAEAKVLAGMRRLVERNHPTLFIEVHPRTLVAFGATAGGVISTLIDYGYEVYKTEEVRRRCDLSTIPPLDPETRLTGNTMLLATRPD